MATRGRRVLGWVLGALTLLVVIGLVGQGAGWWDRLYYDSQGLDVGAPSSSWTPTETLDGSAGEARVAVVGDPGTGGPDEYAVASVISQEQAQTPYQALLLLGDLVYPDGQADEVNKAVLDPFGPLLDQHVRLLPVLGNHDYGSGEADAIMRQLGKTSDWYSTVVGPAEVIVLDSNQVDDPQQTAWLQQTLEQSSSRWIIAAMHHPPYSAGYHGSDLDVRDAWSGLFARYGVDLVLAGHDHDYQRSQVIDGVVYVVSGGGAKTRPTGHDDFTAYSASTLNYLDLQITANQIYGEAIGTDGRAFDQFTIRNPP